MKDNKDKQLNIRARKETIDEATHMAEQLGISRNQYIEDLIKMADTNKEELFVCCPECLQALFNKYHHTYVHGRTSLRCKKGHLSIYDFANEKFLEIGD